MPGLCRRNLALTRRFGPRPAKQEGAQQAGQAAKCYRNLIGAEEGDAGTHQWQAHQQGQAAAGIECADQATDCADTEAIRGKGRQQCDKAALQHAIDQGEGAKRPGVACRSPAKHGKAKRKADDQEAKAPAQTIRRGTQDETPRE